MPRYDWKCKNCGKEADIIVSVAEMETKPPELEKCCDKPDHGRVIKTANFKLAGYGWANTGYDK